jgi:hypothetical protein
MMHNPRQHGWLFRCKVFKYFLLGLFGLGIACLLSVVLGAFPLVKILISLLGWWLVRIFVGTICLMAMAVVVESIR